MAMPSYFVSPEWAIVATQLLAGLAVIALFLGWAFWRQQRRLAGSARRLIADRPAIRQAGERVLERGFARHRPGHALTREARSSYADRSLELLEPLVAAWLEPGRHDLADVMRRLLEIRQEDLEQLLVTGGTGNHAARVEDMEYLQRLGRLVDDPAFRANLAEDRSAARVAEALWLIEALDTGEAPEAARRQAAERLRTTTGARRAPP